VTSTENDSDRGDKNDSLLRTVVSSI
jgi:hypothetical protein